MSTFRLVYIDDNIDNDLGCFLNTYQPQNADNTIEYSEIEFDTSSDYESLLKDFKVRTANIIVIDDRLFEDRTVLVGSGKFTGEEFKLVLKNYFPFIETIVITQNQVDMEVGTISKYKPENLDQTPIEYYQEILPSIIESAISTIAGYRKLNNKLRESTNWEIIIQEKILNSINGTGTFDELTKADIDNLIVLFKEIQGNFQDAE